MGVFYLAGVGAEANDTVIGKKTDHYQKEGSNDESKADFAFEGAEPRGGQIGFCSVQSSSPGASESLLEVR